MKLKLIIPIILFLIIISSVNAVPSGGIIHYDFNDQVNDQWNSYDGTKQFTSYVTDVPSYNISGSATKSGNFNGSSDYAQTSSFTGDNLNDFTDGYSVSVWAKSNVLGTSATEKLYIFQIYPMYISVRDDTNKIRWETRASGAYPGCLAVVDALAELDTGWHHYVGTYKNSTGTATFYIDKVKQGDDTADSTGYDNNYDSSKLELGGQKSYPGGNLNRGYWDGAITEFKLFNTSLNSTQIANLYNYGNITGLTSPPSNNAPTIANLQMQDTTGDTTYYFGESIDYFRVNVTDSDGTIKNTTITIKDPDSITKVANVIMTNISTDIKGYETDLELDAVGLWTINITSFDEDDDSTSFTANFSVSAVATNTSGNIFAYDFEELKSYSDINSTLQSYDYEIAEIRINRTDTWATISTTIQTMKNQSQLLILTLDEDLSNVTDTLSFINNYADLINADHLNAIRELKLYVRTTENATNSVLINSITKRMFQNVSNKFPISIRNYTESDIDTNYATKDTEVYIKAENVSAYLKEEIAYLRNTSSKSRIYYNLTNSLKTQSANWQTNIMNKMRSSINETTGYTSLYVGELDNKDIIVVNYNSTQSTFNITPLGVTNPDAYDYTNKKLLAGNPTATIEITLDTESYAMVYFTNLTKIEITSDDKFYLYAKSERTIETNTDYTQGSSNAFLFVSSSANPDDARIMFTDPSFKDMGFYVWYGTNSFEAIANFSKYDQVVLGDYNNTAWIEGIDKVTQVFGYTSVNTYGDNNMPEGCAVGVNCTSWNRTEWISDLEIDIDIWTNMTTVDIFIDGLDIGAVNDVDGLFGQSLIDLTDYIKISKGREVILNTYTAYEDYANLGDYTMRESACARWDGTTANPTYSYESVATELERADFHKQHGVPVLAQVFGNITDYEKSYYCFMQTKVLYGDLATVSYNQPNFDYTDASDDFQWNYYKYPDIGSELEGDYTTVGTDSYSRRFEHGTITVNTSTHTVEYISDEEINNIELCGYYYDNDDGASDEGYMHFKINDKMSHSFNVVDTDLTAFVKTYKCVNISTDYYEPSGFYEMEFYYIDSDANYLTNGGLYMYHSTVAGNDRLSFYDQNLNDHPVNNEKDYTYYATGDNWALNFTIDKSGTENNLDEVTSVINRTTSGTEIINVTFDSTGSWSLNVYDRTQFINTSIFNNITVSGIVLNWTESDCNTNNPTYGESVINSETWKACKYNHSTKGFYTKVVVPSLSTKSYLINGEIISPTCTLVSVSIADLEVNSTGTYEIIINCSSPQVQINGTSFLIGRTVQTEFPNPNGNHWSLRPPNNDKSTLDSHYDNQSILLADQRVLGSMWYESLFSDNYTWAVTTNTTPSGQNPYVTLDCYAKSCIMNYSSPVEVAIFPSTLYLSRGKMESETKKEYLINSNDGLLIKFWDSKKAHGEDNYTTTLFLNLNYTGKPNKDLNFFYCNSSYNTSGTLAPQDDIDNCVYLSSFDKTYLDSRVYSSRNSSYVKGLFSVINGKIAGIETTKIAYGYLRSQVPNTLSYTVRYTNGTSGTNVSFKDSKTAWTSTNDGDTFTQAEFTPDIWFSQIDNNSQSHIKVYVTDIYGNSYNNLAFRNDTIGDVNFAIGSPSIQAYKTGISLPSNHTNEDEDLNGTYTGFMTIHVNIAIDPDANGIVNHSLYLTNTNGSINYTINSTFYSSDDSDIHIYFNTSLVSSGTYKMNVTAVSDEDLTHETSFLSYNNFTINHVTNTAPYSILNSPTDNYTFPVGTSSVVLNFTALDKDNDTMNITIFKGDGTLLSTQNNIANGTDVTYTWTGLTSGSIYNWYYNITDGLLTNQTRNYSFKILKIDISPSSVSKSISANESFNVIYRVSHNSDTSLPFNISFINTINTTYFNTSFNETSFNVKADQERLIKLTVDSIASTPEQTFTGKTRISQSNQDYDTDITINIQEDYGEPTLYYGNTLCTLSSSNNCYQNGVKTTSESIEKSFKIKNTGDYELLSCVPSLKGDLNESSVTFVPYSFTLAVNEEKTLSYLISPLSEGSYYGYMDVLCDSNGKDVSLDSNNLAILNIAVVNTTSTSGTSGTSGNTPEETTTTNATTDFTFTLSNNILQVNQNDTINYRLYIDNIGTTVLNINLRCYGNLCEETTYNNYTSELAVGESLQIDAETFISEDAKDTELLTFKVYGKSQVLKLQISANVFEKIQHKLSIDLEFGDFKINGMALTIISLIALFTMFYIGILLIPAFNNWEGIAKVLLSFLSSIIITFIVILIL